MSEWVKWLSTDQEAGAAQIQAAWLSLDQNDSDVFVLMRYLIAALRTVFSDGCTETLNLLPTPLKVAIASLSNELAQLPSSVILVMDDYHTIRGEAAPNLLNELLLHWPRPLHLVLISRYAAALPLARLRANDQLVEIRSRDLRFDMQETSDFLNLTLEVPPSHTLIEKLDEQLEGWIGALRLITVSHRVPGSIDAMLSVMNNSEDVLAEYLADEVLGHQAPAVQSFLLKTCFLDRFCAPLCEAVRGESDPAWNARACIDWLDRSELFIVPIDNHKNWYRYHLFQESLQRRFSAEMPPAQIDELRLRASAWFAEQDLIDEALQHALQAGDLDQAEELVERGLPEVLNREDLLTIGRWQHLLPDELIQYRPGFLMARLWGHQFFWQFRLLSKLCRQVEVLLDGKDGARLSAARMESLRCQVAVAKAQEAFFHNQVDLAIAFCKEALLR